MVVNGDRERPFRLLLSNDVVIQPGLDFERFRQLPLEGDRPLLDVLQQDFVTEPNSVATDVYRGSRYDLIDLLGTLSAERAPEVRSGRSPFHLTLPGALNR